MPIQEKFDVVIIGGGVAGISAAIWCGDLGMTSVILEQQNELYGQLRWIHGPVKNYPGILATNGTVLVDAFARSVAAWGINAHLGVSVKAVDFETKTVELADEGRVTGRALFIATGVRRRRLGVPGESEFLGKGILSSGAGEKERVRGKRVVVVGGGDAAAENAILLSEFAERVFLVHRRESLTARTEFKERISAASNIELILNSEIAGIGGSDHVEWVQIISSAGTKHSKIETDHFIARIGVTPNTELFTQQLNFDERGYIIVDNLCRTNVDGVYSIGDVADPVSPTIATAVGAGATAAKAAFALLASNKTV